MPGFAKAGVWGPINFSNSQGLELLGTLTVYTDSARTVKASLYADQTAAAAGPNPVSPDTLGNFTVYAAPGLYYGTFTHGGTTTNTLIPVTPLGSANPTFSVMDYGAKGDGTTDDTTAIQAAITACAVAGGTVVFPVGTFKTSAPLTLASNVWVAGTGWSSKISYTGSASLQGAFYTAASGTSKTVYTNIAIRNLAITFNGSPAIFINGTTEVLIENVFVTGSAGYTAESIVTQYCDRVAIVKNVIDTVPGDGIVVSACNHFTVANNRLSSTADDAITVDADFLGGAATVGSVYGTVVGNTVDTVTNGCGIRVECASTVAVSGNAINNATFGICVDTQDAVSVSLTTTDISVDGNSVIGCPSNGILIQAQTASVDGITVTGNSVSGSGSLVAAAIYGGIVVQAPTAVIGNTVRTSGNTTQQTDSGGIVVYTTKANNSQIVGNRVVNCTGYGINLWNGNGTTTYSGLLVEGNSLSGNGTNLGMPGGAQTTGVILRNNNGYNPVGVVSPGVPGSGSAVGAQPYDRYFWVATAAGTTTMAISNGPTITLAASTAGQCVFVPANQTVTPSYTNAPTWVVEGN